MALSCMIATNMRSNQQPKSDDCVFIPFSAIIQSEISRQIHRNHERKLFVLLLTVSMYERVQLLPAQCKHIVTVVTTDLGNSTSHTRTKCNKYNKYLFYVCMVLTCIYLYRQNVCSHLPNVLCAKRYQANQRYQNTRTYSVTKK